MHPIIAIHHVMEVAEVRTLEFLTTAEIQNCPGQLSTLSSRRCEDLELILVERISAAIRFLSECESQFLELRNTLTKTGEIIDPVGFLRPGAHSHSIFFYRLDHSIAVL